MNMRNAALLLAPAFLLGSCFLPKLKVDESAGGGSGGADAAGAGKSSGTAGKTSGGAGKSSGGASNGGGEAGSGNGDAGSPEPGTGGAQPGAGAGGALGGGAPSGGAPNGGAPNGGAPGAGAGAGGALNVAGAPAGGAAGAPSNPLLDVKKTSGCGKDPVLAGSGGLTVTPTPGVTSAAVTITTSGTKPANCADSVCGAWLYNRDFYVTLPSGYDKNKAYPLVFEGPGCGGPGTAVYPLQGATGPNANNTVIRVGLTPPPNAIGHATNPNQGCFDDHDGDNSVDFVFYENLRDSLKTELCYDENRVFASGNSSGGWIANELGCRYAGNTHGYAIRGIMPNTGGLPTTAPYAPTCTSSPMAGMWIHETQDPENLVAGNIAAINRAITVNGCTGGPWGTTPTANFPIGGTKPDTTCQRITGCPAIYPLVFCLIPGNQHQSHDDTANPGFTTFLSQFTAAPFVN